MAEGCMIMTSPLHSILYLKCSGSLLPQNEVKALPRLHIQWASCVVSWWTQERGMVRSDHTSATVRQDSPVIHSSTSCLASANCPCSINNSWYANKLSELSQAHCYVVQCSLLIDWAFVQHSIGTLITINVSVNFAIQNGRLLLN